MNVTIFWQNGRWYANVYDPKSRRRARKSLGTADRTAAERRAEWLKEHPDQVFPTAPDPAGATVKAVVDYYVDTVLVNRNAAPKSVVKAVQHLRDFETFLRTQHIGRVQQLNRAVVDRWTADLNRQGLSPKSVHNYLATLRACFNAAVDAELLDAAPVRKFLMPRIPDPEIYPLSILEVRALITAVHEHAPAPIADVIEFVARTGQRPSDAFDLTWQQVDIPGRRIRRTQVKTGKLAHFEIGAEVVAIIGRQQIGAPDTLVFRRADGEPHNEKQVLRALKSALVKARFRRKDVNLKLLRHSFASIMLNELGCPITTVQRLLGHGSMMTTARYLKPGDAVQYVTKLDDVLGL